ncbi:CBS domain-containing protein [Actinomadura gamaensis]|uniref:CBS domain-containing protein n=1 Tax=Actinomadura gamaensis TaxID=1763541 RepID=A0ABV9UDU5_9ACTN
MQDQQGHRPDHRAWLIRGGRQGEREERALGEGLAIAGWSEVGDIGACKTWADLTESLRESYPEVSRNVIGNWTGQLWKFTTEIQNGDLVVMPLRTRPGRVAVGRVSGPFEYRPDEPDGFRKVRKVDWVRDDIRWDSIKPDLRASLGSLLTICRLTRNGAAERIAHLAEHGVDPGFDDEDVTTSEQLLTEAVSRAATDPRSLSIRNLLEHWGAERRTAAVISVIRADLASHGLTTRPAFTEGALDDLVALVPSGGEPGAPGETGETAGETEDVSEAVHLTLRLGSLPTKLVSVPSNADLTYVKTLMLRRQFSQVAVIDEDGTYRGAISWESIGRAHIASDDPSLQSAIAPAVVVEHDAPLLEQIDAIYNQGFIFVRDEQMRVTGILTASDLTNQFGMLARPFVLVEEIENRLRRAADEVFTLEELKQAADPRWKSRVRSARDLMFGAYCRLLDDPDRWAKLGWRLDHAQFMELLEAVRQVRNELMHFASDPLSRERSAAVDGLLHLLRTADPRP